jgi:hypothetical protein
VDGGSGTYIEGPSARGNGGLFEKLNDRANHLKPLPFYQMNVDLHLFTAKPSAEDYH